MILLEGNIGAGKSTVGQVLRTSGLFDFIEEPVDRWQSGFASNLLGMFYNDMERWSFTFQILAFITRAKTWQEILAQTDHSRVVLERSIFTDRYVFATNLHDMGIMSETEWQVYCGLWDFLRSNYCVEPNAIVYLRTPAEECMEQGPRSQRRGGHRAGLSQASGGAARRLVAGQSSRHCPGWKRALDSGRGFGGDGAAVQVG